MCDHTGVRATTAHSRDRHDTQGANVLTTLAGGVKLADFGVSARISKEVCVCVHASLRSRLDSCCLGASARHVRRHAVLVSEEGRALCARVVRVCAMSCIDLCTGWRPR
jgi:hypothetical protein